MTNEDLAKLLRKMREDAGLRQWQVAEKLGVTRAAATHYESGLRRPPLEVIQEWANICGKELRISVATPHVHELVLDSEEQALIWRLRGLPPERRRLADLSLAIIQRIDGLALPILAAQLDGLWKATREP